MYAVLRNPKNTGHMVTAGGLRAQRPPCPRAPPTSGCGPPAPVHPAIIDRDTWETAQAIGAEHGTSRDGHALSRHPAAARTYPYRGTGPVPGLPPPDGPPTLPRPRDAAGLLPLPARPARAKDAADYPAHPRTVRAPERRLDQIVGLFLAEHVFGPRRAVPCAAQLPATDQAAAAERDARAAALQAQLKQLDTAQNASDPQPRTTLPRPGRHRGGRHAGPHHRPVRRAPPPA